MEFKKQFKLFKRIIAFVFIVKSKKITDKAYGFSNNTVDNKYVTFIDYDIFVSETSLKHIKNKLKEIQNLFCLSDFFIFETNNGYHAINCDKLNLNTFLSVLNISNCDNNFIRTPLLFGHNRWTLRLSEKGSKKPKYLLRLKSNYNNYEKSLAHIKIIENIHNIKIDKRNCDNNTILTGCKYPI